MNPAPVTRVRALTDLARKPDGTHVVYWMVGFRRPRWNFALQHTAAHAAELDKPLVILEDLRVGYPWASDRLHQFILDGMSANAEAFIDQLITWRELRFNMSAQRSDHDRYESLPEWARKTLEAHESDPRPPHLYSLEQLESSDTHDPIWNAAQTELRETGRLQNYLRMLWGKKIRYMTSENTKRKLRMADSLNRFARPSQS